ncbi:MAG: DUF6259 domain-containing protein [Victivallaceae bacterium]|nr:DUF6259 domain-containing protein [Victivallaceae bacterium]
MHKHHLNSTMFLLLLLTAFAMFNNTVHAYTGEQASTLYRVSMWENGDPATKVTLSGATKGTHEFTQATVDTYIWNINANESYWRIRVTPKGNWGVYEVQFPIFKLSPYAAGDRLLVPHGSGIKINDPFNKTNTVQGSIPRQHPAAIWYGLYPSARQTMQLLIHDNANDSGEGIMYWTEDAAQYIKEFYVEKISSTELNLVISHFPPNTGLQGATWNNHYAVRTTKFTSGWWSVLNNVYRNWALGKKWAVAGSILSRINAGKLPEWFRKNVVMMTASSPTMSYNKAKIEAVRTMLPDAEIGVWTTQWMKFAFNTHYPDYFDPADVNGYNDMISLEDDTQQRVHIFPYMNSILAESGYYSNLTTAKAIGPTSNSWNWNYGADWIQYGDYTLSYNSIYNIMRPALTWRTDFKNLVHENFDVYGVDGHYLDQLTRNSIFIPFNTGGSDYGFGSYWNDNLRTMLTSIRSDSYRKDKVLMGECFSEAVVNAVQIGYGIQPSYYENELIPLFETVYHAHHSIVGWEIYPSALNNDSNFAAALASAVHMGRKVGGFNTMDTMTQIVDSTGPKAFLQNTVAMLLKNIETCVYGRRMMDPVVTNIVNQNITYYHNKTGTESSLHSLPEARVSLWKSESGELVILISNESNTTQSPKINTNQISSGTTLYKHTGGSISYSKTTGIAVPPFSWLALSTQQY